MTLHLLAVAVVVGAAVYELATWNEVGARAHRERVCSAHRARTIARAARRGARRTAS